MLILSITFTLILSAICSLLEAFFLSISTAEIEAFKKKHKRQGLLLEYYRNDIETTTSAILSLNTIANTLGAVLAGGLFAKAFGEESIVFFSIGMTTAILIFSEILPKNVGALYRVSMAPYLIYPLFVIRLLMHPVSFVCKKAVKTLLVATPEMKLHSVKEIQLLAEKGRQEGFLSQSEYLIVANAVHLQDKTLDSIMTPRTVIEGVCKEDTLAQVLQKYNNAIPFARLPVFDASREHIIGLIRCRDILKAFSEGKSGSTVESILLAMPVIPATVNITHALHQLIQAHQQMALVVDEFGNLAGIVTLEDIFECLLGQEIFEKDDVAVDMRELAKHRQRAKKRSQRPLP
ncbi:MAG: hypothetical protein A2Y14_00055 [Verrucomicrobia bacterium GWF2_51_19]|nr:MAG: hypothetical protein A2Y14_00055 [Verrucomicrobia bacterium GWF2_51_19]